MATTTRIAVFSSTLLLVGAAAALRAALEPVLAGRAPLIVLLAPVVIASSLHGYAAGLLALLAGGVAGTLLFVAPGGIETADIVAIGIFAVEGLLFVWLGGSLYSARRAAMRLADEAEHARADVLAREAELQSSHDHLRRVLDSLFAFVGVLDADGTLVEANRAPLQAAGLRASDVIGQRFWECFWWAHDPVVQAQVRQAVAVATGGDVVRIDVVARMAADTRATFDLALAPLRDPAGGVTHIIASAVDISERATLGRQLRAAADAAEQMLARWEAVAASMSDGLAIAAPDGTMLLMNDAGLRILGVRRVEDIPSALRQLEAHDERGQRVRAHDWPMARAVRGERFRSVAMRIRRRATGREWHGRFSGGPVYDGEGRHILSVLTFEDATEEIQALEVARRAEQDLRAALDREQQARAEAEDASYTKDLFVATLSHELRTPLNAILGWAAMLEQGLGGPVPWDPRRALAVIKRNAQTLEQLVDDIIDMNRLLSGRMNLEQETGNLKEALEQVLETHRSAAEFKQVTLHWTGEPVTMPFDRTRFQQAINNILGNAIKFTPAGGRIDVRLATADRHAVIEVRDTGVGIAPDFLPHVFERFRQEDMNVSREVGGLGLGLAIARHLVALHGGTIQAESAGRGQGSTFTVHLALPACERAPLASAETEAPPPRRQLG